jgi:hypothetical protein
MGFNSAFKGLIEVHSKGEGRFQILVLKRGKGEGGQKEMLC